MLDNTITGHLKNINEGYNAASIMYITILYCVIILYYAFIMVLVQEYITLCTYFHLLIIYEFDVSKQYDVLFRYVYIICIYI